jgi:hypothetical protein
MTGPGDPSFADMFQVLVLLAIPAAILLALRYVNRRGERTQRRSSRGRRDHDGDRLHGFQGALPTKFVPRMHGADTRAVPGG